MSESSGFGGRKQLPVKRAPLDKEGVALAENIVEIQQLFLKYELLGSEHKKSRHGAAEWGATAFVQAKWEPARWRRGSYSISA
jgi:hypothetical protein